MNGAYKIDFEQPIVRGRNVADDRHLQRAGPVLIINGNSRKLRRRVLGQGTRYECNGKQARQQRPRLSSHVHRGILTRILQPLSDTVHTRKQRIEQRRILVVGRAPPGEQVDLHQAHWVNVWIAQHNGSLQRDVTFQ